MLLRVNWLEHLNVQTLRLHVQHSWRSTCSVFLIFYMCLAPDFW